MLSWQRYPGHGPWRVPTAPLHNCSNLSVALFAVPSNVWAAWFCSQRLCWLVLSRSHAGQVCSALLSAGDITPTTAHIVVGPIADAKLTPVSQIAREFVGCVDDVWLVACIFLAASCLAPAFQGWLLEGCWLLLARVPVAVLRQGRPPLRPELPACGCVCVCVGLVLCAVV